MQPTREIVRRRSTGHPNRPRPWILTSDFLFLIFALIALLPSPIAGGLIPYMISLHGGRAGDSFPPAPGLFTGPSARLHNSEFRILNSEFPSSLSSSEAGGYGREGLNMARPPFNTKLKIQNLEFSNGFLPSISLGPAGRVPPSPRPVLNSEFTGGDPCR